jgi:hypothetical protein
MPLPTIEIHKPQKLAALMLLLFAAQCLWVASRATPSSSGAQYANCGTQLWEGGSTGAGVSCDPISDGVFTYRAAGLGQMLAEALSPNPSSAEATQQQRPGWLTLLLPRLPFIFFGIWLGGGLWWVARRLYGNEGGFLALTLYCFSPEMIRYSTEPNNEILAAWGAYGVIYTGIGLAHAMQGPRKKWRPRLILLAVALGLTAAAHVWAAILALALAMAFMGYLMEGRRREALPVLGRVLVGAFIVLLASHSFRLAALSLPGSASGGGTGSGFADGPGSSGSPLWLMWTGTSHMFSSPANAGIILAVAIALVLYILHRPSRYFGNTTPLIVAVILLSLGAAGAGASPWVWALPFVLTFVGGVFADALETSRRHVFLSIGGALVAAQVALSLLSLSGSAR